MEQLELKELTAQEILEYLNKYPNLEINNEIKILMGTEQEKEQLKNEYKKKLENEYNIKF